MARAILLVDDEEAFLKLTRDQLVGRGFSVTVASSGEEALEKIKVERPDAIILDIMLPGMSGREVLERLQSDPTTKEIPVIVCSIISHEKTVIRDLLAMGARAYVPKPAKPDDLAAKLIWSLTVR
jgi:CheY-like chemotaxis protein